MFLWSQLIDDQPRAIVLTQEDFNQKLATGNHNMHREVNELFMQSTLPSISIDLGTMPTKWSPETEANMDNVLRSLETSLDELNVAENKKDKVMVDDGHLNEQMVKCTHIMASRENINVLMCVIGLNNRKLEIGLR
jgi:hypothetical protein